LLRVHTRQNSSQGRCSLRSRARLSWSPLRLGLRLRLRLRLRIWCYLLIVAEIWVTPWLLWSSQLLAVWHWLHIGLSHLLWHLPVWSSHYRLTIRTYHSVRSCKQWVRCRPRDVTDCWLTHHGLSVLSYLRSHVEWNVLARWLVVLWHRSVCHYWLTIRPCHLWLHRPVGSCKDWVGHWRVGACGCTLLWLILYIHHRVRGDRRAIGTSRPRTYLRVIHVKRKGKTSIRIQSGSSSSETKIEGCRVGCLRNGQSWLLRNQLAIRNYLLAIRHLLAIIRWLAIREHWLAIWEHWLAVRTNDGLLWSCLTLGVRSWLLLLVLLLILLTLWRVWSWLAIG